jgi:hypothetical protein
MKQEDLIKCYCGHTSYCDCIPKEKPKLTNVCIKCGVDLYYADNFACQEHPKNCKGIHLSEETLKERAKNLMRLKNGYNE